MRLASGATPECAVVREAGHDVVGGAPQGGVEVGGAAGMSSGVPHSGTPPSSGGIGSVRSSALDLALLVYAQDDRAEPGRDVLVGFPPQRRA
jgi:hypothetical protein